MIFEFLILSALFTDVVFGDPSWFPHPVRAIGWLCLFLESFYRKSIKNEKIAGIFTFLSIFFLTGAATFLLLYVFGLFSETLQSIAAVFILYTFIAVKDLLKHSRNVFDSLSPVEKIEKARIAVGKIVGRDTTHLNREGICRACVETVAENMVDGITAPLFWAILCSLFSLIFPINSIVFAAIGIALYKAVNTMDSMFGYKNEKYHDFGWFAARFDDMVNLIPARLSGICIVIGAFLLRNDWRNSFNIYLRDRMKHSSPNAGHTEAAIAGALKIQLGGTSFYFGKEINKPTIGDAVHSISPGHILETHKIILTSSLVFLIISFLARLVGLKLIGL